MTQNALRFVLVLALLPAGSLAAEPERGFAIVHALGERPVAGRVVGVDAAGVVISPSEGPQRTFALDGVREVRFPEPEVPEAAETLHRVTLVGGEVLVGRMEAPSDDGFRLAVPGVGRVPISFDVLRSLEVRSGRVDPCEDLADTHAPTDAGDVAHVRGSGDRYTGTLVEADGDKLVIENERGRKRDVAWSDLLVLHLENDPAPAPEGVAAEIELAAGSRLFTAKPPALQSGTFRFALRSDPEISLAVPLTAVRALRFTGGRFDYASDLPFTSELSVYHPVSEDMAFGDMEGRKRFWGTRKDRRPSGCPLRLAGTTFQHGFAVHSKSVVKIEIGGRYVAFEAAFGIDDEVKRSENEAQAALVDARVVADGEVVWEKKGVTLDNTPHRVGPVDITGVKTLELVVDFGEGSGGMVGDDAAWVNPILVKK